MSGRESGGSGTTRDLLREYYDDLSSKKRWEGLLSENFLLFGTVAKESRGREAYINNNFFKLVRGHRVKELITEGESGFALVNYDLVSPRGKTWSCDVAEFWKARGGKLDSIGIYFDTAAFNAFLAP